MIFILLGPLANAHLYAQAAKSSAVQDDFKSITPKGWSFQQHKNIGSWISPADNQKLSSVITAQYVLTDQKKSNGPEVYLQRLTGKSNLDVPDWKTSPIQDIVIAKRKAKRVERDISQFTAAHTIHANEIPMKEIHVLVSASQGYYLIVYYGPTSQYARHRAALETFLAGFAPLHL